MSSPFLLLLSLISSLLTLTVCQTGNYCGASYNLAMDCHAACPNGFRSECPPGERCFASVTCPSPPGNAGNAGNSGNTGNFGNPTNWCGSTYTAALSCTQACPFGTDAECPPSSSCFTAITTCAGAAPRNPISTSTPAPVPSAPHSGFYIWTWRPTPGFSSATMSVAFSGWVNVDTALQESLNVYNSLVGERYISFGGGNQNGRWSLSGLAQIDRAISNGRLRAYAGVCYDIEEGDSGMRQAFRNSFALAKANGFKVLVTVSHSSPYGFADANDVMEGIISSRDVDFLSPQLYTSGFEPINDYALSNGYRWENYARSSAEILLSIPRANMYPDGEQFFGRLGVRTTGFLQWRNAL